MNEPQNRPFQPRRRTVVEWRYQWRFVLQVVAAQLIAVLGYQGAVQLRISARIDQAPDFATEHLLRGLFSDVFWALIVIGPIMGVLVGLLALRLSHGVVGPVPKFKEALQRIENGDYSARLRFRPGDALEGTDEAFNAAAESLERRHGSNGAETASGTARLEAQPAEAEEVPVGAA